MANPRNVPDGDSVELYFLMPSTRIVTDTTFSIEAKYLDTNTTVAAANVTFALNEGNYSSLTSNRVIVPAGTHHFYICCRVSAETTTNSDRIQVKATPLNNLEWFTDTSFTQSAILANRHLDSSIQIPSVYSTNEGDTSIIEANIVPPSDKPINFNAKITHITTNSTALDGIQISTDGGTTWTSILNNVNFQVPAQSNGFLIKYFIKTNTAQEGSRYFDITVTETTPTPVLKPSITSGIKTRVTVIDTTILNYGDLISTYCNGRDLYGVYSDGNHGSYEEPVLLDAATCGSTILPADTVITTFCAGTTRIQHLSDGSGGYYRQVLAYNSPACGYVALTANPYKTVTPTVLNPTKKGSTVILNPDGDVFGALLRDESITNYSTMFGKWYFEVSIYLPLTTHLEVGLGFGLAAINMAEWLGANSNGWSWWPYDSTAYHSDVQTIYAQTIDVVDKDVIGVYLDMDFNRFGFSINGQFQGWCFENLPNSKLFFLISGRFDSWSWINFGKYAFKYPVPSGFYSGFGTITNAPPEAGTLLSYFCNGVDQWKYLADGKGGQTSALSTANSTACGWVNPTPPVGTVIGYVCDGYDKYNKVADGSGGFTTSLTEINSTDCGYVIPTQGTFGNVLINTTLSSKTTTTVNGDKLSFSNLNLSIIVDYGNLSGIWYWELTDWTGDFYVGFDINDTPAFNDNIWGQYGVAIEPLTGLVNNKGVIEQLFTPVTEGTPIGFKIDFLAQTITIYIASQVVTLTSTLNYPTTTGRSRYFPAVADLLSTSTSVSTSIKTGNFNFGEESFNYSAANGINAYQKPTSPYPQRGTILSYKCDGWTRWCSRADGNGGSWSEIYEVNSATCGWYPDPAVGTLLGNYCSGYDRYNTLANGNYTSITVLVTKNDITCGYISAGQIVSLYCIDNDQWATKSDGNDGFYEELVKANSSACTPASTDDNFSNQLADDQYDIIHDKALPITSFDIIHDMLVQLYGLRGALIGIYCLGYDKYNVYANGDGGQYIKLVEKYSADCNYNQIPNEELVAQNVKIYLDGSSYIEDQSYHNWVIGNAGTGINIKQIDDTTTGINFTTATSYLSFAYNPELDIGTKPFVLDIDIIFDSLANYSLGTNASLQVLFANSNSTGGLAYEFGFMVAKDEIHLYTGVRSSNQEQISFLFNNSLEVNKKYNIIIQRDVDNIVKVWINKVRVIIHGMSPRSAGVSYGGFTNNDFSYPLDYGAIGKPFTIGNNPVTSEQIYGTITRYLYVTGQHLYNNDIILENVKVDSYVQPNDQVNWSNVNLLLSGDTKQDVSVYNQITYDGIKTVTIDTTDGPFGSSLVFLSSGSNYATIQEQFLASNVLILGGAFTFETYVKLDPTFTNLASLLSTYTGASASSSSANSWTFLLYRTGIALFVRNRSGTTIINNIFFPFKDNFSLLDNTWYHLVVGRKQNNIMYAYLDGKKSNTYVSNSDANASLQAVSNYSNGQPVFNSSTYSEVLSPMRIGDCYGNTNVFNGKIAQMRLTVGQSLYHNNYPTQTEPFDNYISYANAPKDVNFNNIQLLIVGDIANKDYSNYKNTITNTTLNTTGSITNVTTPFGGRCLAIGNGGVTITSQGNSYKDILNKPFVFETLLHPTNITTTAFTILFTAALEGSVTWTIGINAMGIVFKIWNQSTIVYNSIFFVFPDNANINNGEWYRIILQRDENNVMSAYLGSKKCKQYTQQLNLISLTSSDYTDFFSFNYSTLNLQTGDPILEVDSSLSMATNNNVTNIGIGASNTIGTAGYISQFRFTVGQSIYSGNFIQPQNKVFDLNLVSTPDEDNSNLIFLINGDQLLVDNSQYDRDIEYYSQTGNTQAAINTVIETSDGPFGYSIQFNHAVTTNEGFSISNIDNKINFLQSTAFTFETWFKMNAKSSQSGAPVTVILTNGNGDNNPNYDISLWVWSNPNFITFNIAFGPSAATRLHFNLPNNQPIELSTWYWLVLQKDEANVWTLYLNGLRATNSYWINNTGNPDIGSASADLLVLDTTTLTQSTSDFVIGADKHGSTGVALSGNVAEMRFTLNEALYTGDIIPVQSTSYIPPLKQLNTNNVKFLLSGQSLIGVDDSSYKNTYTYGGITQVTTDPKFPYGCLYSGSNDSRAIAIDTTDNLLLLNKPFVIETWINLTSISALNVNSFKVLISNKTPIGEGLPANGSNKNIWGIYLQPQGVVLDIGNVSVNVVNLTVGWPDNFTLTDNTWFNFIFQRDESGVISLYVNGIRSNKYVLTTSNSSNQSSQFINGLCTLNTDYQEVRNGVWLLRNEDGDTMPACYLANFRVTIGQSIYSGPITTIQNDYFNPLSAS